MRHLHRALPARSRSELCQLLGDQKDFRGTIACDESFFVTPTDGFQQTTVLMLDIASRLGKRCTCFAARALLMSTQSPSLPGRPRRSHPPKFPCRSPLQHAIGFLISTQMSMRISAARSDHDSKMCEPPWQHTCQMWMIAELQRISGHWRGPWRRRWRSSEARVRSGQVRCAHRGHALRPQCGGWSWPQFLWDCHAHWRDRTRERFLNRAGRSSRLAHAGSREAHAD